MARFSAAVAAFLPFLAFQAAAQPLVGTEWLKAHLNDPHVVVLDIRPPSEYAAGHIHGAIAADYETGGWRVKQADGAGGALPPTDQIAATIAGYGVGDDTLAVIVGNDFAAEARIYWTFKVLGHAGVSILDGGHKAWATTGKAIDAAHVTPKTAHFTPRYDADLRAGISDVEDAVATGRQTLLDARNPAQWSGVSKSPAVKSFGHLPGAVQIDQADALTPDGTALKPKAELAALFGHLGDKPVTAYCNTGHLAATDWFVLSEVLHHPRTRLYDASMSQWTADPSRPVVR